MHPLGVYIPSPTRLEDDGLTPLASRRSMGDEMKLGPSYSDRPLLSSGSPGVRPHQSGGGSRTRADEGGQSATSESARTIPYRARPRSDSRVRIPQTSSAHLTGIVRRTEIGSNSLIRDTVRRELTASHASGQGKEIRPDGIMEQSVIISSQAARACLPHSRYLAPSSNEGIARIAIAPALRVSGPQDRMDRGPHTA